MGSVGLTTSKPPMALASIWRRLRSGPARKIPATNATPIAITLLTIRSRSSSICSRSVISSNTSGSLGSGNRGRAGSLAGSLIGIFFRLGAFSARAMSGSLQSVCGHRSRSPGKTNYGVVPARPREAATRASPRTARYPLCSSIYCTASETVRIFSASSSLISRSNSCSIAMMTSTRSSESALRSPMNSDSIATLSSSTPSLSATITRPRSNVVATLDPPHLTPHGADALAQRTPSPATRPCERSPGILAILIRRGLPIRAGVLLENRAQHPVDEPSGVLATESLGELDTLIDDDFRRHSRDIQQLIRRQPQDIALDGGLLSEVARWRRAGDDRVELVTMLGNTEHE